MFSLPPPARPCVGCRFRGRICGRLCRQAELEGRASERTHFGGRKEAASREGGGAPLLPAIDPFETQPRGLEIDSAHTYDFIFPYAESFSP